MVVVVDSGVAVPRKREVPPRGGWGDPFGAAVFAFSGLQDLPCRPAALHPPGKPTNPDRAGITAHAATPEQVPACAQIPH